MIPPDQRDEALEKALRELAPSRMNPGLRERLDRSFPAPSSSASAGPGWLQLFARFAIPALALAVLATWWPAPAEHPPFAPIVKAKPAPPELVFTPIEAKQFILESEEIALLPGPDERPIQLMRVRLLDYELSRADNGLERLVTSNREQIIPVTLNIY